MRTGHTDDIAGKDLKIGFGILGAMVVVAIPSRSSRACDLTCGGRVPSGRALCNPRRAGFARLAR